MSLKWISVNESVPEEFTSVLVMTIYGFAGVGQYHPEGKDWNVDVALPFDGTEVKVEDFEVLYWMPLPPPPPNVVPIGARVPRANH